MYIFFREKKLIGIRKMFGQVYDAVKREDEGSVRDLLKKATAREVNYQDEVRFAT